MAGAELFSKLEFETHGKRYTGIQWFKESTSFSGKIAQSMFKEQEAALNNLFNNQLPALEKEFEEQGGILYSIPPPRRW